MATIPEGGALWWDREIDDQGTPIRPDVRRAAHEVWLHCCARVRTVLGDLAEAPELMESTVSHVSRHLDRAGALPFSQNASSLIKLHFCQELKRRAGKLGRLRTVGLEPELARLQDCTLATDWVAEINLRLDFEKLSFYLTKRSCTIIAMRDLGHDWPEISKKLGIAISTAQNSFREDLRRARALLNRKHNTMTSDSQGSEESDI